MDKYNIIEPKDSIAALDLEMNQWMQLPTDWKFRSNDDCIRLHGCTVPDYYNFLRFGLLQAEDTAKTEMSPSNLVKEEIQWNNQQIIDGNIKMDEIMRNPYIVIISPNNTHEPELSDLYNNYLNLTAKNRKLSDYYSTLIWGINVQNMYTLLKSKDETYKAKVEMIDKGEDKSNLSFIENFESIFKFYADRINKKQMNHEGVDLAFFDEFCSLVSEPILNTLKEKYNINEVVDEDLLYLPKYCPWFTLKEMKDFGLDGTIEPGTTNADYYKMVIEAYNDYKEVPTSRNEQKLVELGWNPFVEPVWETFKYTRKRQANFIKNTNEMLSESLTTNDDLNYVIMDPINKLDTDTYYVKQACIYYHNL